MLGKGVWIVANKLLSSIPPRYFGNCDVKELDMGNLPLINLAVGIPDGDTPEVILETACRSLYQPENQVRLIQREAFF